MEAGKQPKKKAYVQLHITIALDSFDYLFDFATKPENEAKYFRAITYPLHIPKAGSQCYYFFHKHRTLPSEKIYIQRRRELVSDITGQIEHCEKYRLAGGVKIKRQKVKDKSVIILGPIAAEKISKKPIDHLEIQDSDISIEEQSSSFKPYLLVRSFPKGLILKPNQTLKFGKKKMEILQICKIPSTQQQMIARGEIKIMNDISLQTFREQSKEEVKCRYCWEFDKIESMISPCSCNGYLKYVHYQCIKRQIEAKYKGNLANTRKRSSTSPICSICKNLLPKIVKKNGQKLYMLEIYKQDHPFVLFQETQIYSSQIWYNNHYQLNVIVGEPVTIGRNADNNLVIADNSVSRKQAFVQVNGNGDYVIKDRGSKFGTLLYEEDFEFELKKHRSPAFQIENMVFGFKLRQ